jgi:hypothetical protein
MMTSREPSPEYEHAITSYGAFHDGKRICEYLMRVSYVIEVSPLRRGDVQSGLVEREGHVVSLQ